MTDDGKTAPLRVMENRGGEKRKSFIHPVLILQQGHSHSAHQTVHLPAVSQSFTSQFHLPLPRLTQLECIRFITVGPLADEILALCTLTRLKHLEIRWVGWTEHHLYWLHSRHQTPGICIHPPLYNPHLSFYLPSNHYDEGLIGPLSTLLSSISSLESLTLSQFDLSNALARQLSATQPQLTHLTMGR